MEKENNDLLKEFGKIEEFKPVNNFSEEEIKDISLLLYQIDEASTEKNENKNNLKIDDLYE